MSDRLFYKLKPGADLGAYDVEDDRVECAPEDSDVVSSRGVDGLHYPVLDVDLPARLIESETPGHFHLFIDKGMSWDDYGLLLQTLADVGIIEEGYLRACLARSASFVATRPWKAPDLDLEALFEDKRAECTVCDVVDLGGRVSGEMISDKWVCEDCGTTWNDKGRRGRRERAA